MRNSEKNLVRAIAEDGSVVCAALVSTKMVAEAERIHQTSATVTAALGRLLTAASLMGSMMKNPEDNITIRLAGDGPVGAVIAVADGTANARGYVINPIVEIPLNAHGKLDVAGAVGKKGYLSVVKDVGFPEPTVSHSPIVSGEIAEDITYYYATSEQVPTVCALGVLVNPELTVRAAGGFLLQLLPGASESVIQRVEENVQKLPPISKLVEDGLTAQEIAYLALEGFHPQVLDERAVQYQCNCSRERMERALISLGVEELHRLAQEQETTQVECHFCNEKHVFTAKDLMKMADTANF